jgi:hypothetical protein
MRDAIKDLWLQQIEQCLRTATFVRTVIFYNVNKTTKWLNSSALLRSNYVECFPVQGFAHSGQEEWDFVANLTMI